MDSDPVSNEIGVLSNAMGGAGAPAPASSMPASVSTSLVVYSDGSHLVMPAREFAKPSPKVVILVIDVSGSMDNDVNPKDFECRFSSLDLVKHALLVLVGMMGMNDSVALITFSDVAKMVVPLTKVTPVNKARIEGIIRGLRTEAATNMWEGMNMALALVAAQSDPVHIAVLTDGATMQPIEGLLPALDARLATIKTPFTLSTFGFGYSVETPLLDQVSQRKHGFYGFIPDSSMVGTIFVNYMSTILAIIGYVEPFGFIQAEQSYEVRRTAIPPTLTVVESVEGMDLTPMQARFAYMSAVSTAHAHAKYDRFAEARAALAAFHATYKTSTHPFIQGLCLDIESDVEEEGQVGKAVQKPDWFEKWGRHYLPSVLRAHALKVCSNFKDKGVQSYATDLFKQFQKQGGDLFKTIPPPPGSIYSKIRADGYHAIRASAAPVNMATYYNSSSGCFHGDAQVTLEDGTIVPMKHVLPGMRVQTPSGFATIRKVIHYKIPSGSMDMTYVGGKFWITPYHPIRLSNWVFPCDMYPTSLVDTDTVYNLLLESEHIVLVQGIACCTLAHAMKGLVIEHPYFGTDAVVRDLRKRPTWESGIIVYQNPRWITDLATGLVCETVDEI